VYSTDKQSSHLFQNRRKVCFLNQELSPTLPLNFSRASPMFRGQPMIRATCCAGTCMSYVYTGWGCWGYFCAPINQEVIGDGRCFDPGTGKGFDRIAVSSLFVFDTGLHIIKTFLEHSTCRRKLSGRNSKQQKPSSRRKTKRLRSPNTGQGPGLL